MTVIEAIQLSFRQFRTSPGAYAAVVLTLGIGIGVANAMFGALDRMVLRPLPFKNASRIVSIGGAAAPPVGDALAYWSQAQSLQALAAYAIGDEMASLPNADQRLTITATSSSVFAVFGTSAVIGRLFTDEEDRSMARVAVLSESLWSSAFKRNPEVLNGTIRLGMASYRIIGVARREAFPPEAAVWIPRSLSQVALHSDSLRPSGLPGSPESRWIGLLQPGISLARARAELMALLHRLTDTYTVKTGVHFGTTVTVVPLADKLTRGIRSQYIMLFGASICMLLLACSNAAGIILSKSISRRQEVAVRIGLGASKRQLLLEFLTESIAMSVTAGVLGLVITDGARRWLQHLAGEYAPVPLAGVLSPLLLVFVAITVATIGFSLGIIPALQAANLDVIADLRGGANIETGKGMRVRACLVGTQIALTFILFAGEGMALRGLMALSTHNWGFQSHGVAVVRVALAGAVAASRPALEDGSTDQTRNTLERFTVDQADLLDRLQSWPGMDAVGVADGLAFLGKKGGFLSFSRNGQFAMASVTLVRGQYFKALGLPLLAGRYFEERDSLDGPKAIIVDERTAKELWGALNPIGESLRLEGEQEAREVVGVVAPVKSDRLTGYPQLYLPYEQPFGGRLPSLEMVIVAKGERASAALPRALETLVDRNLPRWSMIEGATMDELIDAIGSSSRVQAQLLAAASLMALLLALFGVYSMTSYSVSCRMREIGVRLALGATPRNIVVSVVLDSTVTALWGASVGVGATIVLSRWFKTIAAGAAALDPAVFLISGCVLTGGTILATLQPAWRASSLNPGDIMKQT